METHLNPSIGLIGIGLMGSALAERALKAKFTVRGYDLEPTRRSIIESHGGSFCTRASDVISNSDWIVYSVMTTDQVRQSLKAHQQALRPGQIVIDCSTGEPDAMADLGTWLSDFGVNYLDATIAGNSDETRQGAVLALVGGMPEPFQKCRPFFDSFASETFHLGPVGHGARMKLVFNLVLGLHRAVLGEALGFAKKLGIPSAQALEILKRGTSYSKVMDNKGDKILRQDFRPQAKLSQHLKDVRLILQLGERYGARLPLSTQHQELLSTLEDAGMGELDNSAIVKAFDEGLPE